MQGYPPHPPHPGPQGPPARGVPVIVWVSVAATVLVIGLALTFAIGIAVGARAGAHAAPGGGADPSLGSRTGPALPAPQRDVPTHDVAILDGCSSADLDLIERRIGQAIELGAPTYNSGDFQGCFSTYERTARDLESRLPSSCKGPTTALASGRTKAATKVRASDKAWAMRDAFDGMLDVIDRAR